MSAVAALPRTRRSRLFMFAPLYNELPSLIARR